VGLNPTVLDIGGGYTDSTFQQIAGTVRAEIAECFKSQLDEGRLRVLAEPGTLFSCSPFYLAVKVVARRRNATAFGKEPPTRLYINDGIYSNFMMLFIVNMTFSPVAVIHQGQWHEQTMSGEAYSIWGRSCDSNDCINRECRLDQEVDVGDWLVFKDMGGELPLFFSWIASLLTILWQPTQPYAIPPSTALPAPITQSTWNRPKPTKPRRLLSNWPPEYQSRLKRPASLHMHVCRAGIPVWGWIALD
jgi:ornithine decarboxylase